MIPDDVAELCEALISLHGHQMKEALVALGICRSAGREQGIELHRDQKRIQHLALCGAGVDIDAVNCENGGGGIEVLIFDASQRSAVHGIGDLRAKAREIEEVRA